MPRDEIVALKGGCLVRDLRSTAILSNPRAGTLGVRHLFGRDTGTQAISLRALEFSRGLSPAWRNEACDEVFYVLEGAGAVRLDNREFEISPDTGFYLRPGVDVAVTNPESRPLILLSSTCPEPAEPPPLVPPPLVPLTLVPAVAPPTSGKPNHQPAPMIRLADREALPSGDRWYRVMVDSQFGCREVTQFVGSIPPGRAPDHYHHYEEVLYILKGSGVMWAGPTSAPIGTGSCIFLPKGQIHCVENTGPDELRLLGVFYPAGSPAVRYDPVPSGA